MKLDGLIPLYQSMTFQRIGRYKFEYLAGKAVFDVFFFIDDSPRILLFGVKAENFSFEVKVTDDFLIDHVLEHSTYKKLCEVLGLKYDPDRPFSPKSFFSEFNANIPGFANPNSKFQPHDFARYRSVAEEAHKIYFTGWRDNNKWGVNVQESNLTKTRDLLGMNAYLRCRQKNISSCWTDNRNSAIDFTLPE